MALRECGACVMQGGNSIGAEGAKAIGEGLQHVGNLQTLNLVGMEEGGKHGKACEG